MKRILFLFLLLSSHLVNSQSLTQSAVQDTINKEIKSPLGVLNVKRTFGVLNRFAAQSSGSVTPTSTTTFTNKTISGANNTLSNISQSSVVGLTASFSAKQDNLISGSTIKTINGTSLLGSGDISIVGAGGDVTLTGIQTLTNKTISGANNTITNIPQASITNLVSDLAGKQAAIDTSTIGFRNRAATISSLWNFTIRPTIVGESILTNTNSVTVTNKSFNGANNTFTNIPQAAIVGLSSSFLAKQDALISGTNLKTINGTTLLGAGDITIAGAGGDVTVGGTQTLTNKTISGSNNTLSNIAQSSVTGLTSSLTGKQDALVSGTSIKTVNGTSLLGSGDIVISAGGGDATLGTAQTFTGAKTFSSFPTFTDTYLNGQATFGQTNQAARVIFNNGVNGAASLIIGYTAANGAIPEIRSTATSGLSFTTTNASAPMWFTTGGSESVRILSNGNFLIGTTTDGTQKLQVNGTSAISGNTSIGGTLTSGAATLASSSVTGNETVGGTLGVTGLTTLSTLNATGATTFGSTVGITGNVTNSGTVTLRAGTATAGTSPLKYISGPLLTTAEAGAQEFLTDKYYGTITTGSARKEFTMNDATLTTGRVPFATTNGRLLDASTYLFSSTRGGLLSVGTTSATSNLNIGATAAATGSLPLATFTGAAHTNQTASTELTDVAFNLGRTVQFATGALTNQRAVTIAAPTYSFVGASTITNASTFYVSGAPIAGTNATITNPYAIWVNGGSSFFNGPLVVGNSNNFSVSGTATVSTIPALGTAASTYLTSNAGVISSRTTSQLATDIGAVTNSSVATLTNKSIDGSTNTLSNIPVAAIKTADLQVFDPTIYALKTRVGTTASSATPTIDISLYDQYNITALATNATFAAPTGTATDGQGLLIRIKDNATARTLGWNAAFRAGSDISLPTTTVVSKTMYIQFVYNSADTKWDLTGITGGF